MYVLHCFFFKQKTAYEVRISDWRSDVCSSDLVETCEQRDPKGLYKRARSGEISQFTGISAPYEPPVAADLVVDTTRESVSESVEHIIRYVQKAFTLTGGGAGG